MTISENTPALTAVIFACTGGKFRVRLEDPDALPGERFGYVLDDNGTVIGDACDRIYGGGGFAVHTGPFAGYVPFYQIEFVS